MPRITASVIGDIVLEVAQDGQIVNSLHMLDILDPYRLSYGSCSGYWESRGFDNSNDWCHSNCATYDSRDDSIIVSLRTQDSIITMDRQSGELKWILGDHKNWKAPWSESSSIQLAMLSGNITNMIARSPRTVISFASIMAIIEQRRSVQKCLTQIAIAAPSNLKLMKML